MKNSEKLRQQAEMEDNDIKAFGIYAKVIREERQERFDSEWLSRLGDKADITHSMAQGKYTFSIDPYGTMDYYPKANKVLIRKKNKWIKPGLRWLIKTFELNDT